MTHFHLAFCTVDCKWGCWEFGDCSVECGGGIQPKFRIKIQDALFNGIECEGEAHDEVECNTQCCPGNRICSFDQIPYGEYRQ